MDRQIIQVTYEGRPTFLDLNKVIAMTPSRKAILFEYVVWYLSDEKEFENAFKEWTKVQREVVIHG